MATVATPPADRPRGPRRTGLGLDPYIVDTLMPDLVGHDRQPSAFLVWLFLWRQTDGARRRSAPLTLREIAEGTGLSKRAVQSALALLARRRLATTSRDDPTAAGQFAVHCPWRGRER